MPGPRSQWCRFITGGVFECDIVHRRTVAVLCVLYKIMCSPMHSLNDALPLDRKSQCGLHALPWSHNGILMRRLAAVPRSTTRILLASQCPSGTILHNRIRWSEPGEFQEQGQCFFLSLSCYIPTIVFYYLSFFLLSVYWLSLWGWGVLTDMVYISLSLFQPCTADLFK